MDTLKKKIIKWLVMITMMMVIFVSVVVKPNQGQQQILLSFIVF